MSTEINAEKARQLSKPAKHAFMLLFPLPIMLVVGIWGNMAGWIGNDKYANQSEISLDLKVPDANVSELQKDKKYDNSLTEEMAGMSGSGLDLNIGNYNSKMLSGEDPNKVGIEANTMEDVDNVSKTLGIKTISESNTNESITATEKKNRIRENSKTQQANYNKEVQSTLRNIYSEPKYKSEPIDPAEKQRLEQNEKLLAMLDKQLQQQNGNNGTSSTKSGYNTGNLNPKNNSKSTVDEENETFIVEPYDRKVIKASSRGNRGNAFYGLNGGKSSKTRPEKVKGAIRAVVHGEGDGIMVKNGTSVFVRLMERTTININGEALVLPANTLVSGISRIAGDRINISINTIRVDNYLYSVNLTAYDLDGRLGLYVPDMQLKNQINQALAANSGQAMNPYYMMGNGSVKNQVGGQLAMQGINTLTTTAKNITQRKMAEQKAFIKPNYQILLMSSSSAPEKENTNHHFERIEEIDMNSGFEN